MAQIDPTHRQRPPQRHESPAPQYLRRQEGALRYLMSKMSMAILDFFQPGEQVGPIGARVMDDPAPPFHVFGEGSSGSSGQGSNESEESESESGDD
ncbi:hypothetical protein Hanom_Chr05g00427581 [Helianthus anomalus]